MKDAIKVNCNPFIFRPEINDMDSVDESDKSAHSSVSSYINDHLLEKVDQDA